MGFYQPTYGKPRVGAESNSFILDSVAQIKYVGTKKPNYVKICKDEYISTEVTHIWALV